MKKHSSFESSKLEKRLNAVLHRQNCTVLHYFGESIAASLLENTHIAERERRIRLGNIDFALKTASPHFSTRSEAGNPPKSSQHC